MYHSPEQREFARRLRSECTPAEDRLWSCLRDRQLGCKFRRQAAIGPWIVDFVCLSHRLIVELDGPQHLAPDAIERDAQRSRWLKQRGFRIIRFRNQELDENLPDVLARIGNMLDPVALLPDSNPVTPPQPSPSRGEGAG